MKTLKAKLFFHVGIILLASALVNTLLSEAWIKKELSRGGKEIGLYMEETEEQSKDFASFLLSFRIVEMAADLERVAEMISSPLFPSFSSLGEKTVSLLHYDPGIAFVAAKTSTSSSLITPEDATLYSFRWAQALAPLLWVYVQDTLFIGVPQGSVFLLFKPHLLTEELCGQFSKELCTLLLQLKDKEPPASLSFTTVSVPSVSFGWKDSVPTLFQNLVTHQNEWLEKVALIQILETWMQRKQRPSGLVKIPSSDPSSIGGGLLTDEIFSAPPLFSFPSPQKGDIPSLLLRTAKEGHDLDLIKTVYSPSSPPCEIVLGFSLSNLIQEIALLIKKTIVVTWEQKQLGFNQAGESFDPMKEDFPLQAHYNPQAFYTWQEEEYSINTLDLGIFTLLILTPKQETLSATTFLEDVSQGISLKITLSLVIAGAFALGLALLLLRRISRKITEPITVLSKAAEELGKGTYEGLELPKIEQGEDEVATLAHSFEGMVIALRDRDKIRGILNKVVSKEVSREILDNKIELGGEERRLTLLFSDIREFTHLAEHLPPRVLIELLNNYFTRMCRIIDETKGVVDKFIGDGIMTLYGAPIAYDFHAVLAIEAALLMINDLKTWNAKKRSLGEPSFEIGIGIHTGVVYTGNIGAENRLNYTAIGSNVNEASRLCSVAKAMQILISEETFQSPGVQERFRCKKLDPVHLKGIEHPVQIYEVLCDNSSS